MINLCDVLIISHWMFRTPSGFGTSTVGSLGKVWAQKMHSPRLPNFVGQVFKGFGLETLSISIAHGCLRFNGHDMATHSAKQCQTASDMQFPYVLSGPRDPTVHWEKKYSFRTKDLKVLHLLRPLSANFLGPQIGPMTSSIYASRFLFLLLSCFFFF